MLEEESEEAMEGLGGEAPVTPEASVSLAVRSVQRGELESLRRRIQRGRAKVAVGDLELVWAKVRGHPWWPAYVSSVDYAGLRVGVNFFGADEHAVVPHDRVLPYAKGRRAHSKPTKSLLRLQAVFEAERYARGEADLRRELPRTYDARGRPLRPAQPNAMADDDAQALDDMLSLQDLNVRLLAADDARERRDALADARLLDSFATLLAPNLVETLMGLACGPPPDAAQEGQGAESVPGEAEEAVAEALGRLGAVYGAELADGAETRPELWLRHFLYLAEQRLAHFRLQAHFAPHVAALSKRAQ